MEGWVGLVGWPFADALPTKWSHVNHGSGVDHVRRLQTDVLTTEPRRQPYRQYSQIMYYVQCTLCPKNVDKSGVL